MPYHLRGLVLGLSCLWEIPEGFWKGPLPVKDYINDQINQYFGSDLAKRKIPRSHKHAIYTYVLRAQEGQSKESALNGVLQGRTLDQEKIQFVRSVLDRLLMAPKI